MISLDLVLPHTYLSTAQTESVVLISRKTLPVQSNVVWVCSSTRVFTTIMAVIDQNLRSRHIFSYTYTHIRLVNQEPRSPQAFKAKLFCYGPA